METTRHEAEVPTQQQVVFQIVASRPRLLQFNRKFNIGIATRSFCNTPRNDNCTSSQIEN